MKASGHHGRGGSIFGGITDNGLFAALAAFLVLTPLFLPLLISVVAGDTDRRRGELRHAALPARGAGGTDAGCSR